MVSLIFIGMIFETFIVAIAIFLLALILNKYYIKRHKLTLYLLIIFINITLAIIFSWISKILGVFYEELGLYYYPDNSIPPPITIEAWFITRILDFRISFIFFGIGMYFSYILKVKLFEKDYNNRNLIFFSIYFIFTEIVSLFVYFRGNDLVDALAFLFIFLLVLIVYLPLTYKIYRSYRGTDLLSYKKGFLSLTIMAFCFIFVLMGFLIDRILIVLGDPGFTFFYFLSWSVAIIGIISAYLGYIRPK